jgi:hypothetical protein
LRVVLAPRSSAKRLRRHVTALKPLSRRYFGTALLTGARQSRDRLTENYATRMRYVTQVQRTWTDAANASRKPGTNLCKTCLVYLQPRTLKFTIFAPQTLGCASRVSFEAANDSGLHTRATRLPSPRVGEFGCEPPSTHPCVSGRNRPLCSPNTWQCEPGIVRRG